MDTERETRFTHDVIAVACDRVNRAKAEALEHYATEAGAGGATLESFGWGDLNTYEFAEDHVTELLSGTAHIEDPEERLAVAIRSAVLDGLMVGAVAADVTYEIAAGLLEPDPC